MEVPSSNQHLGDDSGTGRTNGLEETLGQRDLLLRLVQSPEQVKDSRCGSLRNGPYRMGWKCGGEDVGRKSSAARAALGPGLDREVVVSSQSKGSTRERPCLWRKVLRTLCHSQETHW